MILSSFFNSVLQSFLPFIKHLLCLKLPYSIRFHSNERIYFFQRSIKRIHELEWISVRKILIIMTIKQNNNYSLANSSFVWQGCSTQRYFKLQWHLSQYRRLHYWIVSFSWLKFLKLQSLIQINCLFLRSVVSNAYAMSPLSQEQL